MSDSSVSAHPYTLISDEKTQEHAFMLANRVKKRYAHLRRRFARQNIDCFRLYDWDIPEVRAVVDWYAGHVVIAEYIRKQTGPKWLPTMACAVAEALHVPMENCHIKQRRTKTKSGPRYRKLSSTGKRFTVQERDLKFWVNLDDFLDTGLYSDHRDTRMIVRDLAKDTDFLNLYAYTGAFTCAAVAGGARSSVTVDRSSTYVQWARENLTLNNLENDQHVFIRSDVDQFLVKALRKPKRYSLAFVDPPSFFQDEVNGTSFDVNKDHPRLLRQVIQLMAPDGIIIFSSNHQRFQPKLDGLPVKDVRELTPKTIPEDYRNRKVHRCWKITI